MRARFTLLSTLVVLCLALALPASTFAASKGTHTYTSGYCYGTGNRSVNANFKLVKNAGYHATQLTAAMRGQSLVGGKWKTMFNGGTFFMNINTSGKASFPTNFYYAPGDTSPHRILVIGKIWDGGNRIVTLKTHSRTCP